MATRPYYRGSDYCLQSNVNIGVLASHVVIPSNVIIDGFSVYNSNAADQFLLLFEGGLVPGAGAVPLMAAKLPTKQASGFAFTPNGRFCENGLVLVNSSTDSTLTIGAADCFFDVQVRWPDERGARADH